MMDFGWKDFLQFAVVIPVMFMWRQLVNHQKSHEDLKAKAVTKKELAKIEADLKEYVDLKQEPLEVKLEHIQNDTKDIKDMLARLVEKQ